MPDVPSVIAKLQAALAEAQAIGNSPPPPPTSLTLVRKSPANPGTAYGGYNFQFGIAVIMAGGKIHEIWNGTNEFDAVDGAWTLKPVTVADGSAPVTRPENHGMCWVPGEGVVYSGSGAPVGVFHKFNPATGVYTNLAGTNESNAALLFDAPRNRLLSVGGYTPPTDVRTYPLPGGPWTALTTSSVPPATFDHAKLSMYRAGISSQGRVGFLADANEVYELDGGALVWTARPTTGTKPPLYATFVYYEPNDTYYAWVGANLVAGGNAPVVCKFYALPRATWAWSELAVAYPAGVPGARAMCQNILLADPEREQLVLLIANGYTEMWTLDLRGSL